MGLNNCKDAAGPKSFVEGVVCQENDIQENCMKVFNLGSEENKILLVKQNGKISALGTKCSHYGAPLVNGALGKGRIRCPWHGACFSISTGDIEDFPGLDSIPCYNVEITNDGGVKVRAKRTDLEMNKRIKDMCPSDPRNQSTFVIIGGGGAGNNCAMILRQEGYQGKITLITDDDYLPYDRIKLSKQLDATVDKIQLRSDGFYKEHNIDVMVKSKVVGLDVDNKTIRLENGNNMNYDSVFIATGCKPRKIKIPGVDLKNIFTLRSLTDAGTICKALSPDANVIIYGSSFIGMETAAYCINKAESVTVVGRSAVPFAESLGSLIGERVATIFKEKGVKLEMGKTITEFLDENNSGAVSAIRLSDGKILPASVVIMGLGSIFQTEFLNDSGVNLGENGHVPVNMFLETNVSGVFAGGDIAYAPVKSYFDKQVTIGHWQLAHYHGMIAAHNMLGKSKKLETVPFFWTMLFGTSFRYAGYGAGYDDIVTGGDLTALKFAAYYCKGDDVLAICTVGVDPLAAEFAELLSNDNRLTKAEAQENPLEWLKIRNRA